jgi:hypothetical protein
VGKATDIQDVDLIRKMADRYEDGEVARVLNKLRDLRDAARYRPSGGRSRTG